MEEKTIKLSIVLNTLDINVLPDGKQPTHSLRFVKANGEVVFLRKAVKCGLNMDLKKNAMRGFRAVDNNFNPIGHITSVWIWSIIEFNGLKVSL